MSSCLVVMWCQTSAPLTGIKPVRGYFRGRTRHRFSGGIESTNFPKATIQGIIFLYLVLLNIHATNYHDFVFNCKQKNTYTQMYLTIYTNLELCFLFMCLKKVTNGICNKL